MTSPYSEGQVKQLPRSAYPDLIEYHANDFRRQDEASDNDWYTKARFVQHIDESAITLLQSYYGHIIKPNYTVLDLCSSWVSHLPPELKTHCMIGYGMNQQELERNIHLTKFFVKDLNTTPSLEEIATQSVDVVICSMSIDYLIQPVSIFAEMNRVLKIGGTAHMAFSNRCFPTKVIRAWTGMNDEERRKWVGGYFWSSEGWQDVEEVIINEPNQGRDPLYVARGKKTVTR